MQVSFGAANPISANPYVSDTLANPSKIAKGYRVDTLDYNGEGFNHLISSGNEKALLDKASLAEKPALIAKLFKGNPATIPFIQTVEDLAKKFPNLLKK